MSLTVRTLDFIDEPCLWGASVFPTINPQLIPKPGVQWQRYWDPILELCANCLVFDRIYLEREFMQYSLPPKLDDYKILGKAPHTSTYNFVDDYLSTSSGIFGVLRLLDALKGGFIDTGITRRIKESEKNVKHSTYRGTADDLRAVDGINPILTEYSSSDSRYGTVLSSDPRSPFYSRTRINTSSGAITGTNYVFGDPQITKGSVSGMLQYFKTCFNENTSWSFDAYNNYDCDISLGKFDFWYYPERGHLRISYDLIVIFTSGSREYSYTSVNEYAQYQQPSRICAYDGTNVEPVALYCDVEYSANRTLLKNNTELYSHVSSWGTSSPAYVPRGFVGDTVPNSQDFMKWRNGRREEIYSFDTFPARERVFRSLPVCEIHSHNIRPIVGDLRPGLALAGQKALRDYLDIIQTNHLETLTQLAEIGRYFPKPRQLMNLFISLENANLWGTIKSLADIITSSKLAYEFGLENDRRALLEFADKFDELRYRLKPILGERVLYGSRSFQLPEEEFGGPTYFIAHAKSVYRFTENSMLTTALCLNACGLLPTLSRIWECIPFSFMIDWVVKMQERLEAIDNELFVVAMNHVYSVYSYTVSTELPVDTLTANGLHADGLDVPFVRYYHRFATANPVPYGSSRYDLIGMGEIPEDQFLVGSLAYQLLGK